MKITITRGFATLLILGGTSALLTGCTPAPPPAPAKVPTAKLGAPEHKFIETAKNMSPQEQAAFLRKNPQMTSNSAVMAKLLKETPKVRLQETRGEKPRLPTGRPSLLR